jgi:TIR domain
MAGIFISYRRDDASGHAGRLFDRLAVRFGRDRVFMDVTDIAPGEDFTEVIEKSIGNAELLLAVIGPQWVSATDSKGARRLDEPSDLVRQELVAALRRNVRVIPVLVRGARMPREDELPDALKGLARRQAVELTDARWESDLALFEQTLAKRVPGPSPTPYAPEARSAQGKRAILAAIVIALVIAAGGAYFWRERSDDGREPATPALPPKAGLADSRRPDADTGRARPATAHRALPLPSVARFKLGGQQFDILALRAEPAGDHELLTMRLRMTNNGRYPDTFANVTTTLQASGNSTAPVASTFELIPGYSAKDGELQFPLARSTDQVTLVLRYADEETRIPLSVSGGKPFTVDATVDAFGRPRRAQLVDVMKTFPADLKPPAPQSAQFGPVRFSLRGLRLERYNVERAALVVEVQASAAPEARGGINFWSDNVRLYVDGVPRAPENAVNELVTGGTSRTARFEFRLTDAPERLELSLRAGDAESTRLPIAIPRAN